MSTKKLLASAIATLGLAGGALVFTLAPAEAGTVTADCGVSAQYNTPAIRCNKVTGGEARARADCKLAPDTYTKWVRTNGYDVGPRCAFSARGAILSTRPF